VRRVVAALVAGWLSLVTVVASAEPPRDVPSINVAALAVAGERLYVGGFDQGLFVVEDGRGARPVLAAALSAHINALAWSEPQQLLWVGTARGLVRCALRNALDCRRVGPPSAVHALLLRSNGELLAGGESGLSFVNGELVRSFGKKQGAPFRSVWAIAEGSGRLFVGGSNGLFWGGRAQFTSGGRLSRASLVQGSLPDDWVTALLYRDDALFVGTYNAGVTSFRIDGDQLLNDAADATLGYVNPSGLFAGKGGTLAVATMDGLRRGDLANMQLLPTHTRDVTALAHTVGGDWIGTRGGLEWWPDR
jgi:ligand-binding sensor domain-containing protein